MSQTEGAQGVQGAPTPMGSEDPKELGAKPAFPAQPQRPPGIEAEMTPRPDYGEQSYISGAGRLLDKVALITGGDSGIGRAVALAYAREGADVVISYLNEEADAQETARVIHEAGRRCVAVPGDISQEPHCRQLVERVFDAFGRLDILVNNAAFQMTHGGIEEVPSEEFDFTFRTNVYAMFWLCRAALPRMGTGGAIINTASVQAYNPSPALLAYAATKGAIVTFSKALAQEAIGRGVRVNVVAPGPVWTPLIPATMPPEQASEFGKQTPMGRPAQPAELAPAFVFLASQESSYIVGEVVGVTGGKPLP
ncbi:MAG: Dehydrogenases with different specificities (related to short-chain alcohol dehydrogenases) [uncultured Chloroflexi bacterium]|uniref:Dehydrogenases with different specificities (Related to short-chain alcohol dehydrogenases) n=1 Tax=uncultured Chloroflexota bacterium TaxID=166587 RepID=A0A6J4HUA8_9CHLR|nr:MAG: Dehydrogenases with different specificities (related to short-chain alcohol dehydrogenases) [uncultured Chloroflexota bacterium]